MSKAAITVALFMLSPVFAGALFAADPKLEGFPWPDPANGSVLEVPDAAGRVQLDGRLEEQAWESAGVLRDFFRAEDAGRARFECSVRVLLDNGSLLLGLDLPATEAADSVRKCFLTAEPDIMQSGPHVSICLDPGHSHGVYYQFVLDPAGRKEDLRVFDESWSADWSAAVNSASGRWQAEIEIPLAQIFTSPQAGDIWGFNIALYGVDRESSLSSTPIRIDLVDAERFGHLLFKDGLSAQRLAEIKAALPAVHREARQARLEANRKLCGPELTALPGEITGLAVGTKIALDGSLAAVCLGLQNPEILRSRYPFFYEKYENPDLQRLRKLFRLEEVVAPGRNEFEKILLLNDWLVRHVPFGSPPPIRPQAFHLLTHGLAGQTFNCTYLSFALMQMYVSLGWTARKITTVGHGTLDLWSDYWHKWLQIDPSRNSYFRLKGSGVPLNSNEIRREFWRNGGVDMEIVYGAEQRAEKVTLQTRDSDGLLRYRQDGYAWIAYKTRNNFFEVPYAYRNFLYLTVEDEYNRDKQWAREDNGQPDERQLFSLPTDRVSDIFWTLNQAFIHLYRDNGSRLKVQLETVTPNFKTFEVSLDNGEWLPVEPVFTWELHPGQNFLNARSVSKFGLAGAEHKIVLLLE